MNDWNRLLVTLDKTVGFPNKIRSSVKKRWQGYDQWKNEHVIWLEYRIKVTTDKDTWSYEQGARCRPGEDHVCLYTCDRLVSR